MVQGDPAIPTVSYEFSCRATSEALLAADNLKDRSAELCELFSLAQQNPNMHLYLPSFIRTS